MLTDTQYSLVLGLGSNVDAKPSLKISLQLKCLLYTVS